jgi:hypothetical protein
VDPNAGTAERDEVLREIVARLVQAIDPQKLILFGSRATGHGRSRQRLRHPDRKG